MSGNVGVVVHLVEDDPGRQHAVLANVTNLMAALTGTVPVELVAHGPGVSLLTGETGLAAELRTVIEAGAFPVACENTLRSRKLTAGDLVERVGTVDSGMAHLARRQLHGWAYLRP